MGTLFREQQGMVPRVSWMIECSPPVPIELAKCVELSNGRQTPSTTPSPCRRRKRPRKNEVGGYEASLHEADAAWPDDGSLSKKSVQHRRMGLIAIDSLNRNAWPSAEEYCMHTEADVVFVQEAKIREVQADDTEAAMRATC